MTTNKTQTRLTQDEEREALEAWRARGDRKARDVLVASSLWVVESLARRFRCSSANRDDLVAEGSIALLHAMNRFDPDRGVRLATYAHAWVRAAMTTHLLRESNALGSLARARHGARLRRTARTSGDLAALEDASRRDVWLDCPVAHAPRGLVETLVAKDGCPEAALDDRRSKDDAASLVTRILSALPPTERLVLLARYGTDGREPATTEEIASTLGLSRERVRQIEERARQRASALGRGVGLVTPRSETLPELRAIDGGRSPLAPTTVVSIAARPPSRWRGAS